MFDIGFWELCLIAVVALLILGPERLPIAARTAGLWIGRARRMIGNVKSEIDRELQLDEIRQKIKEGENSIRESSGINDLESLTENTIADVENFQSDIQDPLSSASDTDSSETNSSENDSSSHEYEPLPQTSDSEQSTLDFVNPDESNIPTEPTKKIQPES